MNLAIMSSCLPKNFSMQYFFTLSILVSSLALCSQNLSSVESVEYDAVNHRFLAGNGSSVIIVDGNGDEVDYFGSDPEADYGMEVMGNTLFCIVGSAVKGYDLTSGAEVMTKTISGAQFLNGLASDGDHRIWVTDFNAKKIHELDVTDFENVISTEVVSSTTTTPNGIVYDEIGNRLVFVNWGGSAKIKAVALSDYAVTTLTTTMLSNLDGIDSDSQGNYFVSSWSPTRITKFNNDFSTDEIITAPGIDAPADICYAIEIDTLAIPNSGNNTITFVGLNTVGIHEGIKSSLGLSFSPNPVTEQTVVEFELNTEDSVLLEILNEEGKRVYTLVNERLPKGRHKILMAGVELSKGVYFYRLKTTEAVTSASFVK